MGWGSDSARFSVQPACDNTVLLLIAICWEHVLHLWFFQLSNVIYINVWPKILTRALSCKPCPSSKPNTIWNTTMRGSRGARPGSRHYIASGLQYSGTTIQNHAPKCSVKVHDFKMNMFIGFGHLCCGSIRGRRKWTSFFLYSSLHCFNSTNFSASIFDSVSSILLSESVSHSTLLIRGTQLVQNFNEARWNFFKW